MLTVRQTDMPEASVTMVWRDGEASGTASFRGDVEMVAAGLRDVLEQVSSSADVTVDVDGPDGFAEDLQTRITM